jgi:hypothetical protein
MKVFTNGVASSNVYHSCEICEKQKHESLFCVRPPQMPCLFKFQSSLSCHAGSQTVCMMDQCTESLDGACKQASHHFPCHHCHGLH